jgi:hypothetical protein
VARRSAACSAFKCLTIVCILLSMNTKTNEAFKADILEICVINCSTVHDSPIVQFKVATLSLLSYYKVTKMYSRVANSSHEDQIISKLF